MNKRELIDEIVSLNQTAQTCFLARFDDADLHQYLQHLRDARRPRLTAVTGRFDHFFRPVPPATENVRPVCRPAARSTWRVEPKAAPAPAATPVPAQVYAGSEPRRLAAAATGLAPAPAAPAPAAEPTDKKDASAEVELDRLADEDLDLAIRWTSRTPVSTSLQVTAPPLQAALQTPAEDLVGVQAEPQAEQPVEFRSDPHEQDQAEFPAQPEVIVEVAQAEDFAGEPAAEEVTAEEKAALNQDEPPDQAEESYEEADLEPFQAPAPIEPAMAEAIQTIQGVLGLSQQEPQQPELTNTDAAETDAAGVDAAAPAQADSAADQARTDLASALEAEPVEPDLEAAAQSKARPSRRDRRDEDDSWLF